ncbi:MAG TPA: hypothetical protein GXX40_05630 [Firmicutes bacterium]|nr:hypothetical protein [Bacillota bacterium]
MESTAPELLYSGAWGAGKSRVLCEKALYLALKYPGNFVGICRKTFNALKQTTMRTFFREACPPDHIKSWNKTDHLLTLKNGSQVYFFGLDDPLKIQSLNLGACGVDEVVELTEEDWTVLGGRIRLSSVPFRQLFAATNPASPSHWLYKRFYIDRSTLPDGRPLTEVVESNSLENPYLPPDYVARIQTLTGRYRERFVLGRWVGFEGLVYDCFDPLIHVVDKMPEGWQKWPKVRSIDFGYANPFVCQWWAISPDDEWYLYREIYFCRRLVSEHAAQIKALSAGETYLATYADHDAEDRATLEACGIPTVPAVKDVSPGIQEVYSRLQPDERGKPRLYFLRGALVERDPALVEAKKPTCTIDEIQGYQYPKPRGERNPQEEPIKLNDHGMDAMRYAIYSFASSRRAKRTLDKVVVV